MALDAEDLSVISAHMQDAVLRVADMTYLRAQRKFAVIANRFAWEKDERPLERRRSGLQFARVGKVLARDIDRNDKEAVLSLLSLGFEEGEAPSGAIVLNFSGGGALRIEVECIEAQLADLGPAWATEHQPQHLVE
jgi:hypothetical protein